MRPAIELKPAKCEGLCTRDLGLTGHARTGDLPLPLNTLSRRADFLQTRAWHSSDADICIILRVYSLQS